MIGTSLLVRYLCFQTWRNINFLVLLHPFLFSERSNTIVESSTTHTSPSHCEKTQIPISRNRSQPWVPQFHPLIKSFTHTHAQSQFEKAQVIGWVHCWSVIFLNHPRNCSISVMSKYHSNYVRTKFRAKRP